MIRVYQKCVVAFCLSSALLQGCGGGAAKPAATQGDATVSAVAPEERLAKAVKLATLHVKYKEYDHAEKLLQEALADPQVTATTAAIELLDTIKAAKRIGGTSVSSSQATQSQPESKPLGATSNPASTPAVVGTPTSPTTVSDNPLGLNGTDTPNRPTTSTEETTVAPTETSPKLGTAPEKSAGVLIIEDQAAPATPAEKVAATDALIAKLEARLQSENEAAAALKIYERFVERHTLTEEQEKKFATRVAKWREITGKELVRWGTQWISPELAQQKKAEADGLVAQAEALMQQQNFKEVAKLLDRASKIDLNGISADFILGQLNSGIGANHPPTADEHYRKVLVRSPRHLSALNNLALTEIKMGRFPQALARFRQAAEIAPRTPEINQNVGRLIKEATTKKLVVLPSDLSKFNKLYGELTKSGQGQPSNPNVGWLYMPLYLSESERKGKPAQEAQVPEAQNVGTEMNLVLIGSGSGFVVHPGYFLTNRHVVRDDEFGIADRLKILDPTDPTHKRELPATVMAISAEHDLALVKCDAIKSPAIPLSLAAPRRGLEVLALGYPKSDLIGRGLKATRGIITALPEEANAGMLLFDAELNGGNSGGPVLTKTGEAIGVATAKFNAAIVGNYSAGVPSAVAIPFVKTLIPNFGDGGAPVPTVEQDWPDVDARTAPSTVMLLCYYRSVPVRVQQVPGEGGAKGKSNSLEDTSCSACNGTSFLACPQKGCIKGSVSRQETYTEVVGFGIKRTVNKTRFVQSECPVCDGKGRVDCRACSGGRDTSLRGR